MRRSSLRLTLMAIAVGAAVTAVAPAVHVVSSEIFRVWRVGSPHRGDTPTTPVAAALKVRALDLGYRLAIESYPAIGFAARFREAIARNEPPAIIAFDNFGVMDGITTPLGRFEGIGQEPTR